MTRVADDPLAAARSSWPREIAAALARRGPRREAPVRRGLDRLAEETLALEAELQLRADRLAEPARRGHRGVHQGARGVRRPVGRRRGIRGDRHAPDLSIDGRLIRYETALAELDPPFAFVDLDAMWSNSDDMLRRAGGKPIRVASKSLRCRGLLSAILDRAEGYRGLLTFTLPETLWLAAAGFSDLLVAYPTTDRSALRSLAALTSERPSDAPIVMVDSLEHLDLIEAAVGSGGAAVGSGGAAVGSGGAAVGSGGAAVGSGGAPIRVCLDFDASYWIAGGRAKLGPKRTPVHSPAAARRLAEEIAARPAFALVAMMSYEGHIAGLGDLVPGNPLKSAVIARLQRASYAELRARRAEAVASVRAVADLELVNAGGTGDLQLIADEDAVTEATAGSGFYAPALFDTYSSFRLEPAAMFVLPVCRRPAPDVVTALGGGYLASGVGGKDRMPRPYLPAGLSVDSLEGTGEVQTPLHGQAARSLRIGDRVYFRHVKAGELCERFDRLYLVAGDRIVDELPTYRGEGKTFL